MLLTAESGQEETSARYQHGASRAGRAYPAFDEHANFYSLNPAAAELRRAACDARAKLPNGTRLMTVSVADPLIPSPWFSVWWNPRDTIGRIVTTNPKHHVSLLAVVGGVSQVLSRMIVAGFTTELFDWRLIVIGAIAGAIFGVGALYVSAILFSWSGRMLGGHAPPAVMRAVLAWGSAPMVVSIAICLIAVGVLKLSWGTDASAPAFPMLTLSIIAVAFGLWSWIATMLMFARIQRFGFWRTVAGFALGYLFTIALILALLLPIRTFLFQPFNIPSGSMKATLLIGDYLLVSKFSYGYSHYSLPLSPPLFSGRIFGSAPERGDVVVFRLPKDDSSDYIMRVIGLPGDRIKMIDGLLHINGVPVKRERVGDFIDDENGDAEHVRRWRETLPNGLVHETLDLQDNGFLDTTQEYLVPTGHYFMMGDNRDNSADSRVLSAVGYVPFENLIGRAEIIYFSVNRITPASQPSVRSDRIGMTVR
jgi:signal peptidase I